MVAHYRPFQWTLVLGLLVSTGFSGCFDDGKEDAEGDVPSLFQRWTDEPEKTVVPIDEIERYYRVPDPDACDGCIPLESPPAPPKRPVEKEKPGITIPLPQAGDRASLHGTTGQHPTRDPVPLATDTDGSYTGSLRVLAGDGAHARFRFGFLDGTWDRPFPVAMHEVEWNVSLVTRTVTNASAVGYTYLDADLRGEDRRLEAHLEPRLETAFWLGAHLWGRELRSGETFATHWKAPGTDAEYLQYTYKVLTADRDSLRTGQYAHHEEVLADASVQVTVRDIYGNRGEWRLLLDEASPYPVSMASRGGTVHQGALSYVPAVGHGQRINLIDRGGAPLAWGDEVIRPSGLPAPSDAGFLLGERQAGVALDRLPLYPLRTALDDLALLDAEYQRFVQEHPSRVLIEATYTTREVAHGVLEHEWGLLFTDRAEGIAHWTVARASSAGVLASPTPLDALTAEPPLLVDDAQRKLVRLLSDDPGLVVRLASGTTGIERLLSMEIEEVDALHYRLDMEGTRNVGGTLSAYRHLIGDLPHLPDESVRPLGYFVQDLSTRVVTETGILRP